LQNIETFRKDRRARSL